MLERLFVVSACVHRLSMLAFFFQRLNFSGTPKHPGAADVDVALGFEVGQLEAAEHGEAVVVWVVVVPLVAVGVDEEDVVGEGVVVVDYVAGRHHMLAGRLL